MSTAADFHDCWRNLPVGELQDIVGTGTCLILTPHPDDESLGCGGLIARCVAAGRPPLVVLLTDGTKSHPNSRMYPPDRLRAVRARELLDAVGCLGLSEDRVVFLGQPDSAAPRGGLGFEVVVAHLVALMRREPNCTAIVAPWQYDPHCDHEAAFLAARAAAAASGVRMVAFPVWGWTLPAATELPVPVKPGWRLDIRAFAAAKRAAIQTHRSQFGGLITDDPTAFQLPADLLAVLDRPYETFLQI
jgi:LmbE family N-acetylglucosaminyl deacetylase